MALGRPGRLTMSVFPRMPAVWRERMAVGTCFKDAARISSPNPGSSFVQTAAVASGVTSRGAGPVPPVVTTRPQPASSAMRRSSASMAGCSSGTTL